MREKVLSLSGPSLIPAKWFSPPHSDSPAGIQSQVTAAL